MKIVFLLVLLITFRIASAQDSTKLAYAINLYGNHSLDNEHQNLNGGLAIIFKFSRIISIESGIRYMERGSSYPNDFSTFYGSSNNNKPNFYYFYSVPIKLTTSSRNIFFSFGSSIEWLDKNRAKIARLDSKTESSFEFGGGYILPLKNLFKIRTGFYLNKFLSGGEYSNIGLNFAFQYK